MDNLEAIAGGWASDIIETAKATQPVQLVHQEGSTLFVALHKDQCIQEYDLEPYAEQPRRIRQHLRVVEVKSFIDYWQRFAGDTTSLTACLNDREFTAIFDDHAPGKPAWRDHKCTLICRTSTEWDTWSGKDKQAFSQIGFAEFIETNAIDIVDPAAAVMIEVAMTLQANKKVKFNSGVRLDNGQIQLGYHEVIDGSAGAKGDIKIPDQFTLALRIFQGGEKYKVPCHLRYRINDGDLKFFYQIIRPERLLEDAFEQVKAQVEKGCTGADMCVIG